MLSKIILDKNQKLLADFATQRVIDYSQKISGNLPFKEQFSSKDWDDCNRNSYSVSCLPIDESYVAKCKHHTKIDEVFNHYEYRRGSS